MLDPLTLDQLRVFIAVAEAGSFSAAARKLKRAQSAVSHAVMTLERTLNVQLFDRAGHRPVMTEAGRGLLPDARSVIARANALKLHARNIANELEPELSLATNGLLPNSALLEALSACQRQFPRMLMSLYTESHRDVDDLLMSGTCILGISSLVASELPLQRQLLTRIELATVVAANHELAGFKEPIPTSEMQRFPQLVLTDNSSHPECDRAHMLNERPWQLSELEAKRKFILAGFGWANLPLHMVEDDLSAGRLARIFPAEWGEGPLFVPLYLVHQSEHAPGRAAKSFIGHLRDSLERAGFPVPADIANDYAARRTSSAKQR